MTEFLSEENIGLHQEYVRKLSLKYSILEKSIDGLKGKKVAEILRGRYSRADLKDILSLLPEIELHEIYFSSFAKKKNLTSLRIREAFGNEASFLNELYKLGMALSFGFVSVNIRGAKIENFALNDYAACFTLGTPFLVIDVCEHAYFQDYGFDKQSYLINALAHLDLAKIDGILK